MSSSSGSAIAAGWSHGAAPLRRETEGEASATPGTGRFVRYSPLWLGSAR